MDITYTIMLVVVCLILGVILDNLVHFLLKKEPPPEKALPEPGETIPMPLQAAPVPSIPSGLEEIARIWMEAGSCKLVLEMGGQQLRTAGELSIEQRTRLESSLDQLLDWLGKPLQTLPPQPPAEVLAGGPAISSNSTGSVGISANRTPLPAPANSQPVVKPILNPFEIVVKAFQTDVKKPDTTKTLAEQVDEILQEKLAESPLRDKGIRLIDTLDRGLVVLVGLEKYDGVDAVPDEQVKAVLREAVDEWGKRASTRKV
jgi:hypothetical protein